MCILNCKKFNFVKKFDRQSICNHISYLYWKKFCLSLNLRFGYRKYTVTNTISEIVSHTLRFCGEAMESVRCGSVYSSSKKDRLVHFYYHGRSTFLRFGINCSKPRELVRSLYHCFGIFTHWIIKYDLFFYLKQTR